MRAAPAVGLLRSTGPVTPGKVQQRHVLLPVSVSPPGIRLISRCSVAARPVSTCGTARVGPTPVPGLHASPVLSSRLRSCNFCASVRPQALKTSTEELVEQLKAFQEGELSDDDAVADAGGTQEIATRLSILRDQAETLSQQIDAKYAACFSGCTVGLVEGEDGQMMAAPVLDEEDHAAGSTEGAAGTKEPAPQPVTRVFESMSEAQFAALGREEPKVMEALLAAKQDSDPEGWTVFQAEVRPLKLQRGRVEREVSELSDALQEAVRRQALAAEAAARAAGGEGGPAGALARGSAGVGGTPPVKPVRVVLLTGFESFNVDLYRQVAQRVRAVAPHVTLQVFSDRELVAIASKARVEAALQQADVFFGSLLFDFDQVEWLRARIAHIPVRLVFESALELMSCTQVGSFSLSTPPSGQKAGPPPVVKKVLGLFGSQREEDKMVGYLAFLKVGPKLLKWVPGKKAADLRHWLTIYGYWNQGGVSNVLSMVLYLVGTLVAPLPTTPAGQTNAAALITPPLETPPLGCLHPLYQEGRAYFTTPAQYWEWYQRHGPLRGTDAPVVGVLLYRKHVITEQPYVLQLISQLEAEGVLPVPVFINGVEAHTVVRDLLTSSSEQQALAQGRTGGVSPTLSRDAVRVDAVVSTIGFPLVGGPAGSMEAGRQADVAKTILSTKNIPYVVAAPLLIQDMASWTRDGVAGLQSVVLYALPELDGAVDTVPLGGLVGDNIYLVPERVKKVAGRLKAWVNLRRKPAHARRVAILLYGFPPGVGAVGTAALLNVPRSLQALLTELQAAGYDLGDCVPSSPDFNPETLVTALTAQDQQRAFMRGAAGVVAQQEGQAAAEVGWQPVASDVSPQTLKAWLTYPADWGPTEWGPLPFLPDNDVLVKNMEKQWGDLRSYRGLMTSAIGNLVVPGLQAGNVFVGVQPVLGVEGDPMRLLFERDLTPHPQYAAFYKWLQHEYKADVVLHFGMHGTVEWLPGAPLGNTGLSWSDVLLGNIPNTYVYACNNPSESIIAKRRGYGTIVSHNVPPYGRAGLYKQLATLKDLISEWREARAASAGRTTTTAGGLEGGSDAAADAAAESDTRAAIFSNIQLAGLQEDVPFFPAPDSPLWAVAREAAAQQAAQQAAAKEQAAAQSKKAGVRAPQTARGKAGAAGANGGVPSGLGKVTGPPAGSLPLTDQLMQAMSEAEWGQYMSDVFTYLQVLENRLYSEGLHVLGQPPTRSGLLQYLSAYFEGGVPEVALEAVADASENEGVEAVRARLERLWAQSPPSALTSAPPAASTNGTSGTAVAASSPDGGPSPPLVAPSSPSEVPSHVLEEALKIKHLLGQNTQELSGVLRSLAGEYILPEAGGDLLRDGAGVLPTGRNIHALDPYRMPSPAALTRGAAAAQAILDAHTAANGGTYPETVAVNLWGLDAIKTKGESVAMVLHLVGAVPVREGTGRIARFELLPLSELGRPRVDVLCNMSGIFRDSFQNVVELLDDLFQRAASAEEPAELNFVRKHVTGLRAQGVDNPAARLFSNPAGDYGSMVNERVGAGNWERGEELGDTWAARNAFSYGKAGERGTARPEVLQSLLSTTQRVVQQVDSVEYGLTDIQEYYANTGALARAASNAQQGAKVGVSIVEAFSKDPTPRELDEVLRLEYRSKLLNPKWAAAMAAQGSGGAYEISQRMTAMVGWGATSGFAEGWAWDQAAATYALDSEMAATLRKNNPQAYSNVLRRMLEAAGRGMWKADSKTLSKLRSLYGEMDDQLEGVTGPT